MRAHLGRPLVGLLLVLAVAVVVWRARRAGRDAGEPVPGVPEHVTFARDVSPIVFRSCAPCHRPGQAAPFSLLDYDDVAPRARQIAIVTESRFMPPWLPAPGHGVFAGDRHLADVEIETLRRWAEQGAPEGDPTETAPVPTWRDEWQLGTPDLVSRMPEPYALRADGQDVFRNFVFPIAVDERKYVRAVEFRPRTPRAIHHATIRVDRKGLARELDREDAEPGYGDMSPHLGGEPPDGHFLGWTPGKMPSVLDERTAWALEPGTDLVAQLHMLPTGKPEVVQPRIGLYFTPTPPSHQPVLVSLGPRNIDIPAGDADYVLEDSFRLPVDAEVLGIYPHAHYLCVEMRGRARLPDGSVESLIYIPDWDFNWQDEYRYAQPVSLPAGTALEMEYRYDNSAGNVRNPNQPPRRVQYGGRSSDEMGELVIQLLPGTPADAERLKKRCERKRTSDSVNYYQGLLSQQPTNPLVHWRLAEVLHAAGDLPAAAARYAEAARLGGETVRNLNKWGSVLLRLARPDEAEERFRGAIRLDPGVAKSHRNLGNALYHQGRLHEAARSYRDAIDVDPEYAFAYCNLGAVLAELGQLQDSAEALEAALRLDPDFAEARRTLAEVRGRLAAREG